MPILFGLVSRGTTVLAKYASCSGNFMEVVEQVLARISPEHAKLTYEHGNYLFHYIAESKIIYLCITDDDFERSKAFAFLKDIKRRFESQYGERIHTALPYAMNSDFSKVMSAQIRHHCNETPSTSSSNGGYDKVSTAQTQIEELKGIMVKNIDQIAARGERLELLVDKTEDLSSNAVSFKRSSRTLARSMWLKNIKLTVIIVVVVIIVIYFIVSIACGGLAWNNCVHHS